MRLISEQVKAEVAKRLKASKQTLDDLGAKRQTPAEQYQYLIEISMKFQRVVVDALGTNYGRHRMFHDHPSLRLVTAAVNRSEAMATMFAKHGHTFHFQGRSTNDAKPDEDAGSDMGADDDEQGKNEPSPAFEDILLSPKPSDQLITKAVRQFLARTAVDDLLPNTLDVAVPQRGEIFNWLRSIYRDSRGFEIGTVNPTLLATIMREQSRNWEHIALGYVADVIVLTHTFVNDLLSEVCPSRRVREGILSLLMDQLCVRYKAAIKHVEFLLEVDLHGTPSTLNHYFNDNLQKWYVLKQLFLIWLTNQFPSRQKRMRSRIDAKTFSDRLHGEVIRTSDLFQHDHMGNDEHTIQDLHDILQSYYKVARKRFVDALRMQAVDHFLISGPDTPLTLFSPAFVAKLSPEELDEAAGEDRQVKRQRASLEKAAHDLEEAMKILR